MVQDILTSWLTATLIQKGATNLFLLLWSIVSTCSKIISVSFVNMFLKGNLLLVSQWSFGRWPDIKIVVWQYYGTVITDYLCIKEDLVMCVMWFLYTEALFYRAQCQDHGKCWRVCIVGTKPDAGKSSIGGAIQSVFRHVDRRRQRLSSLEWLSILGRTIHLCANWSNFVSVFSQPW